MKGKQDASVRVCGACPFSMSLNRNKAPGLDNMQPELLKAERIVTVSFHRTKFFLFESQRV